MHHAAAHRDQQRSNMLHDAGALECADAARGEREIDRAARVGAPRARIGRALVERRPRIRAAPARSPAARPRARRRRC